MLYILWLWRFPHRPHFHGVQAEVLLSGELGAAVGGALGSGTAVTSTKVAVQPQAEVAVLTSHTLMEQTAEHSGLENLTQLLSWQFEAGVSMKRI